jgi:NAD(P)-dependent dehydrogenase (short-subunit alcohol dehydrogenase family)
LGTPADVAHLVAYLASDKSGYTAGTELVLDGHLLAGCA